MIYDDYAFGSGKVSTGNWAPSRPLLTGALSFGSQHMSIRIRNVGDEPVRIDDVYIDPYGRG